MAGMGYAVMGTATAKGERRAMEAAQKAIASPLLEAGAIDGARGILINVTGSSALKLAEVNEASTIIQSAAHEDANIIFGAVMNEQMKDEVKITVIATGFKTDNPQRRERTLNAATTGIASTRGTFVPTTPTPAPSVTVTGVSADRAAGVAAAERDALSMLPEMPLPPPEEEDLDVPAFIRKRAEIQ
jgi:cell division protein FtsZ